MSDKPASRYRITIVVEAEPADLDEGLANALVLAKERVMFMTFRSKRENGPRWHCRTAKVRAQKRKGLLG